MTLTNHVIKRFQERVTSETQEVVRFFIEEDLRNSTHLYRLNNIEKRECNGVVYVLDCSIESNPTVITLYLK